MNRFTRMRGRLVLGVAIAALASAAGVAQTVIYPPSGPGGNYIVAVIGDGYTADEEWKFDRAVDGLILKNGLMADPFYSGSDIANALRIKRIFKPVAASGASLFAIKPNYHASSCYIDFRPGSGVSDTTPLIESAVGGLSPERTVVIGNYEGMSFGCAVDTWTYVSAGARESGGVMEHEFGHLVAGLWDEYALPNNGAYTMPPVDGPNCSNQSTAPIWNNGMYQNLKNLPGCKLFATNIIRPYERCRMRSHHTAFCDVCAHNMKAALTAFLNTSQAQLTTVPLLFAGLALRPAAIEQTPTPSVRVLVRIDRTDANNDIGGSASVVKLTPVDDAPIVHRYRRTGDYVYAIVETKSGVETVLESGVLAGDPFQPRSYAGASAPHGVQPRMASASIVVMMPNLSRAELKSRRIGIRFFHLDPLSGRMNNGEHQEITPTQLKEMMGSLKGLAEVKPEALATAAQ